MNNTMPIEKRKNVHTFSTDTPAVSDKAAVGWTINDGCDFVCGWHLPYMPHHPVTQVLEKDKQLVSGVQLLLWHSFNVLHTTQRQGQVDHVCLRDEPQKVLCMVETVQHVSRDISVAKLILKL